MNTNTKLTVAGVTINRNDVRVKNATKLEHIKALYIFSHLEPDVKEKAELELFDLLQKTPLDAEDGIQPVHEASEEKVELSEEEKAAEAEKKKNARIAELLAIPADVITEDEIKELDELSA